MRKILAILLVALAITCIAGGVSMATNYVAHADEEVEVLPTHNDTSISNTESPETQAFAIPYDGSTTIRYGAQAYAGIKGPAWVIGSESGWTDCGTGSHAIGSNSGDGRSNLEVTFKIDSTVEGPAYLMMYAESYDTATGTANLTVNGGEAVAVSIKDSKFFNGGQAHDLSALEINLVKGMNTVVLSFGENYTFWIHSFYVSPEARVIRAVSSAKTYHPIALIVENYGGASHDVLGLNAFDNPADYGKKGGAMYKIYAPKTGEYTLGFFVMAGHGLANRATYTLNGKVVKFDGNDYFSFSTAAGWGGDSWNYMDLTLNEGINTLKIENYLTYVNANKNKELEPGEPDGVYVSNWWMHQFSIEEKQEVKLVLDIANVQTNFNPDREFNAKGLIVKYVVGEKETVLSPDQYTVSAPNLRDFGGKEVVVEMLETGLKASYSIAVGNEGTEYEGKVVEFNGVDSTGKLSYYMNAGIKGEGTDECAGRIFYIIADQKSTDGYFTIGSGGAASYENRQVTFTLKINNTGDAGKYLIKSYANANNFSYDSAIITENGVAREVNLYNGSANGAPYTFEVDLKQGENVIEIKTQNQYSIWWVEFEVCAINAELKATYGAKDGIRYGIDSMHAGVWQAKETDRMLSYYLDIPTDGKYEFTFKTAEVADKKFTLAIGDASYEMAVDAGGATKAMLELKAGLQKMSIICSGAEGAFDFNGFNLEAFVIPDAIEVDTSNMTTVLECGEALNTSKLVVNAKYGDTTKALEYNEYEVVYPTEYAVDKPGTYTITVRVIGAEEVQATFDITVKAEKEMVALEVNSSAVKTTLNVGETLNTAELVVKIVYNDGSKQTLSSSEYTVMMPEGYDAETAGKYIVTVEYNANKELTATFEIEHVATQQGGDETSEPTTEPGTGSSCKSSLGGSVVMTLGLGAIAVFFRKRKED